MNQKPGRTSESQKLVKECIFIALTLLMEQKDYADITITDITKKAGVSRMAYYRNYESKEDILREQAEHTFATLATYAAEPGGIDAEEFYRHFFIELKSQQHVIRNLAKANLLEVFWSDFMNYFARIYASYFNWQLDSVRAMDTFYFFSGGLLNLVKKWTEKDKTSDDAYMVAFAMQIHGYFTRQLS